MRANKQQSEYGKTGDEGEDSDEGIPMLLCLNKVDLVEELIESGHEVEEFMTPEYFQNFSEDHNFIGAMCTSAKTGAGVTEAIACLVRHILVKELQREEECNNCAAQSGIADQIYDHQPSIKIGQPKKPN